MGRTKHSKEAIEDTQSATDDHSRRGSLDPSRGHILNVTGVGSSTLDLLGCGPAADSSQDRERAADAAEAGLSSLGGAQARALAFGRAVGSTISGGSAPAPGAGADCARRGVVAARLETRQNGRARGVILCVPPPGAADQLAICGLRQAAERHHRFRVPLGVASKLYYPRSPISPAGHPGILAFSPPSPGTERLLLPPRERVHLPALENFTSIYRPHDVARSTRRQR
jgi:hypothetical protein